MLRFETKYNPEQDIHQIPAVSGARSIEGLAHSLRIIIHFGITGKISHREPFKDNAELYLSPPKKGSFGLQIFANLDLASILVGGVLSVPASIAGNALYDLVKHTMKSATGQKSVPETEQMREILGEGQEVQGNFGALIDAIEPPLKRAHAPIGQGVTIINVNGGSNTFNFNSESKRFLTTNIKDEDLFSAKVSIGSFNANNRTGGAYFEDHKKSIRFRVSKLCEPATMAVISSSLDKYTNSFQFSSSSILIRYKANRDSEGRIRSILIFGAEPNFS